MTDADVFVALGFQFQLWNVEEFGRANFLFINSKHGCGNRRPICEDKTE
jgi:hypothetical protein